MLWGPTRLGKTEWARSLGPHVFWSQNFNITRPVDDVDYAVFDDMGGLKYLPTWKAWLGQQKEFECTDKYKGKRTVKWGRPTIWVSNKDPRHEFGLDADDVEWLDNNCTFIHVTDRLY